jgi:hypothetical protein
LDQPHLGSVWVQGCACSAIAWLSDGGLASLGERNRYRMPEGRQYLGLKVETDHVWTARSDVSHGTSGGCRVCDVDDAGSGIGQQTAHKLCVVGRN